MERNEQGHKRVDQNEKEEERRKKEEEIVGLRVYRGQRATTKSFRKIPGGKGKGRRNER